MYETDTGIGGGVFLQNIQLTIPASSAVAVPVGTYYMTGTTGIDTQINTAAQGATAVWVNLSMNPIKSDGAEVQLDNTNTNAYTVTLIEVNMEA